MTTATEYSLVPIGEHYLVHGKYLGKQFTFKASKHDANFKQVFLGPVSEESPSGAHKFHEQIMYLYDHCPTLHDKPRLPEPKPFVPPKETEAFIDLLETMKLMLSIAIHDLKEGKFSGA